MKKIALSVSLVLAACASLVAAQQQPGIALLWIPAEDSHWPSAIRSAADTGGMKLTVPVSLSRATRGEKDALLSLVSSGRAEIPLRIYGDPLLPLLFSPSSRLVQWKGKAKAALWGDKPEESAGRLFSSISKYKAEHKKIPAGFVPAAGGATPELVTLAKAAGIGWIASGKSGGDWTVLVSSDVRIVPFTLITSTEEFNALADEAAKTLVFGVVDETLMDEENRAELMSGIIASTRTPQLRWQTVSDAVTTASTAPVDIAALPGPWSGDYSRWASTISQQAAMLSLGRALEMFGAYRNSASQNSATVKSVEESFAELEESARFALFASTDALVAADAEKEFKTTVSHIYQAIDKPIPPSALRSFADQKSLAQSDLVISSTMTVSINAGPTFIEITNPPHKVTAPNTMPSPPSAAQAAARYGFSGMRVSWKENWLQLAVLKENGDQNSFPEDFMLDFYIDMNHRARSGSTHLLDGRNLRTAPEDGWEFAVVLTRSYFRVFKFTPSGPHKLFEGKVKAERNGELIAEFPRDIIRGNPKNWGYMAASFVIRDQSPKQGYPLPYVGSNGAAVLDCAAMDRIGSTAYFIRLPKTISMQ